MIRNSKPMMHQRRAQSTNYIEKVPLIKKPTNLNLNSHKNIAPRPRIVQNAVRKLSLISGVQTQFP